MRGNRVLVLNDGSPLYGGVLRGLRSAGAEVLTAQTPSAAQWYVDGERLHAVLVFLVLDRMRRTTLPFVARVRESQLNGRVPVSAVVDNLDPDAIKRLAALRIGNIIRAPKSADEVVDGIVKSLAPPSKAGSYDVRLINCFLTAARDVLHFYVGPALQVGKPGLKQDTKSAGFVTGLIAFSSTGQLGSIAVTFERPFIEVLAAKALGEKSDEADDAGYADLAGEMCNQVLGKAKSNLESVGVSLDMGLPELLVGTGHAVPHKVDDPVVFVPLQSGDTRCVVEFTMGRGVVATESRREVTETSESSEPSVEIFVDP